MAKKTADRHYKTLTGKVTACQLNVEGDTETTVRQSKVTCEQCRTVLAGRA